MANEEHLEILRQGAGAWDAWRRENPSIRPSLSGADLLGEDLRGTDLREADLREANLSSVALHEANLYGADLRKASLWDATLARLDLRGVKGLEEVTHHGPSTIGIDTLEASGGEIPEVFLRGCGVSDSVITYARSLVADAIEFYSCFISYRHQDEDLEFAERIHCDLQAEGVRCWFARHDLPTGAETRQEIDEAIRLRDKLVVVLSERSIESRWVQKEVETAFAEEDRRGKLVLFPVRIDDAVMDTTKAWAADIRRMRNIGDFTRWKDHDAYRTAFQRVLRDLHSGNGPGEATQ